MMSPNEHRTVCTERIDISLTITSGNITQHNRQNKQSLCWKYHVSRTFRINISHCTRLPICCMLEILCGTNDNIFGAKTITDIIRKTTISFCCHISQVWIYSYVNMWFFCFIVANNNCHQVSSSGGGARGEEEKTVVACTKLNINCFKWQKTEGIVLIVEKCLGREGVARWVWCENKRSRSMWRQRLRLW